MSLGLEIVYNIKLRLFCRYIKKTKHKKRKLKRLSLSRYCRRERKKKLNHPRQRKKRRNSNLREKVKRS